MMKFLHFLENIKQPPSNLHLVDMALFLALLPHLDHLKFPMLVYLIAVTLLLLFKKSPSKSVQYVVMAFGLLSVISSFYTDFNFSNFTTFALYLSFLNAMLIYAVTLQRLSGTLNFYLTFSPAMLLMLSFFLHNSVFMLFYMVFVLFVFLLLFIWQKMGDTFYKAVKTALSIFAFSLPIVALLFVVFPRISFEKADYGFKDTLVKRSGHNGTMSLGSDAMLVPSSQVVMEVFFPQGIPKGDALYFRGTTLYKDDNSAFRQLPLSSKHLLDSSHRAHELKNRVHYDITLYAHNERWLYALDIPLNAPPKSKIYDDYTLLKDKKVEKNYRYSLDSYLGYKLDAPLTPDLREAALQVNRERDPLSAAAAKTLHVSSQRETLENLKNYFRDLQLTYTLKPDALDKKKPIDSFIQGSKKGYCVHFAAAFTYMARVAKLPTRVITGFMVERSESLNNYLVVREYTAHAWCEVYIDGAGWIRVDPTHFATSYEAELGLDQAKKELTPTEAFLKYTNLRFMYVKYVIERWILEYSRVKQMEILDKLLHNTAYLLKFVAAALALLIFSILLAIIIKTERCQEKVLCYMRPLLKDADKKGITKEQQESMHDYLLRLKELYSKEKIEEIDRLYHHVKYAKTEDQEQLERLKVAVLSSLKAENIR